MIENNGQLKTAVLEQAQSNHIWINAFMLIRPTDEILISIGRQVVNMLREEDNLVPAYHGAKDNAPISDIQKLTKMLYLSVNQS